MAERVEIVEMAPRDGLQNEKRPIPTAEKIALVNALSKVGYKRIEVAAFVSPKWVPQMADGAAVLAGITRAPGVHYTALTPNLKGLAAARAAQVDGVAVFASASEGFSQANLNCSIAESLERFRPLVEAARAANLPVRGYVSMVTDCPFEGAIPPAKVARVVAHLRVMGCDEVSLGDTIGQAHPESVRAMLAAVLEEMDPAQLAGHFHDTAGRALDNIEASLAQGLRVFDAAAGGLGGCPYAPGAAGNVATEAVAAHLARLGYETGLNMAQLAQAAAQALAMKGEHP
ncbi:hydroxymethylglutaryl-CoA lyase [Rhodobacter sp. TJ_12]|uniref:hydroxymethylglutaryl-CoA lyase n=1 Tax=Rhodobacter sp. TJ_12 TaxID=2029399 RepID=UPI001CBFB97D|nr:hydroxymethylglutaryl-CoA lyase [Rhodobacter sp. TJ_12]MBZ4022403.1 hydroxymethylglutaryl-CoA lyase [Rhodobacter sp. TJ_12]